MHCLLIECIDLADTASCEDNIRADPSTCEDFYTKYGCGKSCGTCFTTTKIESNDIDYAGGWNVF